MYTPDARTSATNGGRISLTGDDSCHEHHVFFVILADRDFGNGPPGRMSPEPWNPIQDKADQYAIEGKFVAIAETAILRDDTVLYRLARNQSQVKFAYAWADQRLKREIICALGELRCEESRKFLRDYLAMDEATAGEFAAPLFEEATRAFLCQQVAIEELEQLLQSTNSAVRGTTILVCLHDQSASRTSMLRRIVPWTYELPPAGK